MTANPTLLSMPLAQNGQKNVIPATQATAGDGLFSQSTGFPAETSLPLGAGGKAPTREDFNGVFNLLSNIAFYAQKGWTFEYDENQDYYKGCIIIDPDDGKRYECIADMAAGTVSPHEDTNNDYWKVFSTGGGVDVGFIMPYAGTGLQEGWLDCDGSAVSRTMYPDLFAAIGTTWGAGDGSTTFNLPRSEDLLLQGASATNPVGTYKTAGLPNITGSTTTSMASAVQATTIIGAITQTNTGSSTWTAGSGSQGQCGIQFDASQSNAIYGNSTTVQPPAACVRFMIKAFDGQTPDSALIDVTQYAADLANKATRSLDNLSATGEDHFLEKDFTIIYPNGGSEGSPANITLNSRYVETNPFAGYAVNTTLELYNSASAEWVPAPWCPYWNNPGNATTGAFVGQQNDGNIVIITASSVLLRPVGEYSIQPNIASSGVAITSAPCRVKVWKVGKVNNA